MGMSNYVVSIIGVGCSKQDMNLNPCAIFPVPTMYISFYLFISVVRNFPPKYAKPHSLILVLFYLLCFI